MRLVLFQLTVVPPVAKAKKSVRVVTVIATPETLMALDILSLTMALLDECRFDTVSAVQTS